MPTKHVIIGAGPAGINAMTTIRELESEDSEITLITSEHPYSRMVLPYYIAGNVEEGHVNTGSPEYFANLNVRTMFGSSVASIDSDNNQVTLDDGTNVPYDNLLIATGSSAAGLSIEGTSLGGVTNLWTMQDAKNALAAADGSETDAVFVGAGFIGLIILNAAYKAGWQLNVVEVADQILPRMLDSQAAPLVESWLARKGVGVHTGVKVESIAESGGKKQVKLDNGNELSADVVIMATGIKTNIDIVAGTSIETNEGILVNNQMQTSIPNIYAAGDVAEGPDLLTGGKAIHAIQPTAVEHGKVAGANMAGKDVKYWGSLLINILDVCKLQCASFGNWAQEDKTITVKNESRPIYRKLAFDGDVITGASFVGPAEDVTMLNDMGMVKGLIQTQTPLGDWKTYLEEHPLDIRRPYIGTKAAAKLLKMTISGQASSDRGYRHNSLQPTAKANPHHAAYMGGS